MWPRRRLGRALTLAVGCALVAARPSAAATLTFPAVADTYARSDAANTNFNASSALYTDASPASIIYLRFTVSGTAGRPVQQARLRLQVTERSTGSGGTVHRITNGTWAETTLTWANRPALDGPGLHTLGPVALGATVEFNLDGAIPGDGTYDLAIDSTASDGVSYASNSAASGLKPTLVLTVGDSSPTSTTVPPPTTTSTTTTPPASTTTTTQPPGTTLVVPPVADTYVQEQSPSTAFGGATTIRGDHLPLIESFLRFSVTGVGSRRVQRATLRLTVASGSSDGSDCGGRLHAITNHGWSEQTTTWSNRPAVDGPALFTAGPAVRNATIEFDATALVDGDGTYDFALVGVSDDGAGYRSREASSGKPELIISVDPPPIGAPTVGVVSPPSGTTVPFGQAVTLTGQASDPQQGNLSASLVWTSSLDGALGTGASLTRSLGPGWHTITATVTDAQQNRGSASTWVVVQGGEGGVDDFGFGDAVETSTNRATSEKPESKLWWHDGSWWATLFSPAAAGYRIHRFDSTANAWRDTGVIVDPRPRSRQDVLPVGNRLYVASRFAGAGAENRLYRYTFFPAARRYVLDSGFPIVLAGGGTEAFTLAQDSTGALWIAYTLGSRVWVSRTQGSDFVWSAPFVVPVSEGTDVSADDIAAVVALPGQIGVFWNNQVTDTFYLALHSDAAPATDPAAWQLEIAARGGLVTDDHMNVKVASDGRLFVAVKTSRTATTDTLIGLLVRSAAGVWAPLRTVSTAQFLATRPQILLDEVRRLVYVFYAPNETAIYYKTADLAALTFVPGIGTPLIVSSATSGINNPTTTKQGVSPTTGIVVEASTPTTKHYWHATLP
jgi:hypothetical protein